jgi:hypothetical protein
MSKRGTSTNFSIVNKMLTSVGLRGLLLDGRQLVVDRGQLLFEGFLGLSSAYNDSGSTIQDQDLVKHADSAQGNDEDLPSTSAWRSEAASLEFRSVSSNFFSSTTSFCA